MSQRADEVSRRSAGERGQEPEVMGARVKEVTPYGEGEGPEQPWAETSRPIDALREKLNPERLKGQAKELVSRAGQTARGKGTSILVTIKQNPLPKRDQSTATTDIMGRPSQDWLVGTGVGSLVALGSVGAAWLYRRRQRERNQRRTVRLVGGLGGGLALLMLGMLLGWILRGRRLRTARVTVTEALPGTEVPTDEEGTIPLGCTWLTEAGE